MRNKGIYQVNCLNCKRETKHYLNGRCVNCGASIGGSHE